MAIKTLAAMFVEPDAEAEAAEADAEVADADPEAEVDEAVVDLFGLEAISFKQ